MPVKPVLVALLLCETIITEADTNTKTLVRVADRRLIHTFPARVSLVVFIKFSDAEGLYTFRIEHAYGPSNVVLGYVDIGPFEVGDRLRHHSIEPTITVEIPSPGFHEFRVFANGSYMGRAILEVIASAR